MSAKSDLLAWVELRAIGPEDAKVASKRIAAYVAECVKADREKQAAADPLQRMVRAMRGMRTIGVLFIVALLASCEPGPDYGPCIESHDETSTTVQLGADGNMTTVTTTDVVCDVWAKGLGGGRILVTTKRGQTVMTVAEMEHPAQ